MDLNSCRAYMISPMPRPTHPFHHSAPAIYWQPTNIPASSNFERWHLSAMETTSHGRNNLPPICIVGRHGPAKNLSSQCKPTISVIGSIESRHVGSSCLYRCHRVCWSCFLQCYKQLNICRHPRLAPRALSLKAYAGRHHPTCPTSIFA